MDRSESIYKILKNGESSIDQVLWGSDENSEEESSVASLSETEIAQPELVTLGLGLADIWSANDVRPDIGLGQSIDELTTACAAGAITI